MRSGVTGSSALELEALGMQLQAFDSPGFGDIGLPFFADAVFAANRTPTAVGPSGLTTDDTPFVNPIEYHINLAQVIPLQRCRSPLPPPRASCGSRSNKNWRTHPQQRGRPAVSVGTGPTKTLHLQRRHNNSRVRRAVRQGLDF